MNALTRLTGRQWNPLGEWNPFREMEEMQNRMLSLFDRNLRSPTLRSGEEREESLTLTEWSPVVDITEDKTEYLIKAEIPEVKKENLHVTLENGVLSITGERKFEKEEKDKKYHRIERSYGSFTRSFTLPENADPAKVKAEFKEGVLNVHVGKSEHVKPSSTEIKIA